MLDSDILQAILPLDKINVVRSMKHHQSLLKKLKCRSKFKTDLFRFNFNMRKNNVFSL